MLGRSVMTIEQPMAAGAAQAVTLDGNALSSGVYVYRLQVESGVETIVETGRMTVVR
jgi:hypothetical protein